MVSPITVYSDGVIVRTEDEADLIFQDFINELHPTVSVLGYVFDPARALKDMDEDAYRQEFLNWSDSTYKVVEIPDDIWLSLDNDDLIEWIDANRCSA